MLAYIVRRLLLIIPTLLGILLINFVIIQAAPGGPIDRLIASIEGEAIGAIGLIGGEDNDFAATNSGPNLEQKFEVSDRYRGIDAVFIQELQRELGFDKPWYERFATMVYDYMFFDFGNSIFRGLPVIDLVLERLPISISLGLWSFLIIYLISIPLGIVKAIRYGSRFDTMTSAFVLLGYAIPGFLFAVLLIVLFAGGRYLDWFPLRGLVSNNWDELSAFAQIVDYLHHLVLPVLSMVIGGFATLTLLTRNSFLEELAKPYVLAAKARGAGDNRVLYGHVFRNAMMIVISGFPSALVGILFTGALLTEIIFSIDGLGLLGYQAVIDRDFPVIFASLWFFSLLGLVMHLITDLTYMWIDPRLHFEKL